MSTTQKLIKSPIEVKLAEIFGGEKYLVIAYKNGYICLDDLVTALLKIKNYTRGELIKLLFDEFTDAKLVYKFDYIYKRIKNGGYSGQNKQIK